MKLFKGFKKISVICSVVSGVVILSACTAEDSQDIESPPAVQEIDQNNVGSQEENTNSGGGWAANSAAMQESLIGFEEVDLRRLTISGHEIEFSLHGNGSGTYIEIWYYPSGNDRHRLIIDEQADRDALTKFDTLNLDHINGATIRDILGALILEFGLTFAPRGG